MMIITKVLVMIIVKEVIIEVMFTILSFLKLAFYNIG